MVISKNSAFSNTPAKPELEVPEGSYLAYPDEPTRLQIRIVTAESARAFAKENPTQQLEPTNGVHAFDGEFVSGNVTFVSPSPGTDNSVLKPAASGGPPRGGCSSLRLGYPGMLRGPRL
jgi:hypothetical protein